MEATRAQRFEFDGFVVDCRKRSLVDAAGKTVTLSQRAFDALVYFLRSPGQVIDRRILLDALWPGTVVDENNLSQLVVALRRTLGDGIIVTVPRRGYQFVAEVQSAPADGEPTEAERGAGRRQTSPRWTQALLWSFAVTVALVAGWLIARSSLFDAASPRPLKIAVLPCESIGLDPRGDYVAAGLHQEILNRLGRIRGLLVVARSSVLQYEANRPPISRIAGELSASAVMECGVQHAGGEIMVTARLVDPHTDAQLWAHSYPGDLSDVRGLFAMQADIAGSIADELGAELSPVERLELEDPLTDSPEAYAAYLRAVQLDVDAESAQAVALLDEATQDDPAFARAYALRGIAHLARARRSMVATGDPSAAQQALRAAWADAGTALDLDPRLGLAHFVLASRLAIAEGDPAAADEAVARALTLSPNDSLLLLLAAGRYLGALRIDAAHALLERIAEIDPNVPGLAWMLWLSGDVEGAAVQTRRYLAWHPTDAASRDGLALLEILRGNSAEASRQRRIADEMLAAEGARRARGWSYVYIYGRLGLAAKAEAAFEDIRSAEQVQPPINWVYHYLGIGDESRALEWARRVAAQPLPPYADAVHAFVLNATRDPVLERPEFAELRLRLTAGTLDRPLAGKR